MIRIFDFRVFSAKSCSMRISRKHVTSLGALWQRDTETEKCDRYFLQNLGSYWSKPCQKKFSWTSDHPGPRDRTFAKDRFEIKFCGFRLRSFARKNRPTDAENFFWHGFLSILIEFSRDLWLVQSNFWSRCHKSPRCKKRRSMFCKKRIFSKLISGCVCGTRKWFQLTHFENQTPDQSFGHPSTR